MNHESRAPYTIWDFVKQGYCLIDQTGKLVCEPRFLNIHEFAANIEGGYIAAAQDFNGKWGYIDQHGIWIVEPEFEEARIFTEDGLSRFKHGGLWGYISLDGMIKIEPRFADGLPFSSGYAAFSMEKGLYGYVNTAGEIVISEGFKRAGGFSSVGLAPVGFRNENTYGYIDTTGNIIIKPQFTAAHSFSKAGVAPVQYGEKWGLINTEGAWIVEPKYENMHEFNKGGLAYFEIDYKDAGYINEQGEEIIRDHELSKVMRCGLIQGKLGYSSCSSYFDKSGKVVIDDGYWYGEDFHECGSTVALKISDLSKVSTYQWGVLRYDGTFIELPYREPVVDRYHSVLGFDFGLGAAPFLTYDGTVAYVDSNGQELCRIGVEHSDRGKVKFFSGSQEQLWECDNDTEVNFPQPFLRRGPQEHFTDIRYWQGDLIETARKLLAESEREFCPYSLVYGERRDVYDLSEEDEYDLEEKMRIGSMLVLAESYVDESSYGQYTFLSDCEFGSFGYYLKELSDRLTAAFGEPSNEHELTIGTQRNGSDLTNYVWQVEDKYLVLEYFSESGDGDFECQLRLAAGTKYGLKPQEDEADWGEDERQEDGYEESEGTGTLDIKKFSVLMSQAQQHVVKSEYEDVLACMEELKALFEVSAGIEVQHKSWFYDFMRYSLYELGRKTEAVAICREAIQELGGYELWDYLEEHNHPRHVLRVCFNMLAYETIQQADNSAKVELAWTYIKECFSIIASIEDKTVLEPFYPTKALILLKRIEYAPEKRSMLYGVIYKMEQIYTYLGEVDPKFAAVAASDEYKAFTNSVEAVEDFDRDE